MGDSEHRAPRVTPTPWVVGIVGCVVLLLGLGVFTVVQVVGDDRPETALDRAGSDISGAAGQVDVRSSSTPTKATDPADPGALAGSEQEQEQRRADVAVQQRSAALGKLVALAEKKAAKDAKAAKARKARRAARAEAAASTPISVVVGSFNVLGSQHTAPGGDRRSFPPASVRSVGAVNHIVKHGVDILGTQELQDDQLSALQGRTGMAAYPGLQWGVAETDNSILYDAGRFEFVSGDRFIIPFMGRPRPQPILRLRDRGTGREFYVVNTHPSAHDGRYLVERRQGHATLVSVVNELKQSGLPVLVTGDMNDREIFYCNVVPQAGLTASNGGSYGSGCQPPPQPISVDWVVGSGVTWSNYWRDTTPVTTKISDHFFISATATFGPAG